MKRFQIFTIIFLITSAPYGLILTDGAIVSPEILIDQMDFTISDIDALTPEDLNLTQFISAAMQDHPHSHLNVTEIIRLHDYVAEFHSVTTSDGHILQMHRIAGNTTNRSPADKPVAFLMHGLLSSSSDWVIAGPEKGLAFVLADAGYDVWMGNARGNKYSRLHTTFTTDDHAYWGFSWHEIGTLDLPTMIDYVLAKSGQEKLFYIGHSQGTTAFFVMTSEKPEYNNKVQAMFSLAPITYSSQMFSPIVQFMTRMVTPINLLFTLIGQYEFKPSSIFMNKFKSLLCMNSVIAEKLCMNVLFLITGFNKNQFDLSLLPAVLAHIPAGSAVNQFVHYAQIIKSGGFRKYDYGYLQNLYHYTSFTPPEYNLNNVRVPVSLHYSTNDWLSHPMDVEKLFVKLSNPIGKFLVPNDNFNHIDYLWGKDAKNLVYRTVLNLMERYKY